jgi:hypothetical protein
VWHDRMIVLTANDPREAASLTTVSTTQLHAARRPCDGEHMYRRVTRPAPLFPTPAEEKPATTGRSCLTSVATDRLRSR